MASFGNCYCHNPYIILYCTVRYLVIYSLQVILLVLDHNCSSHYDTTTVFASLMTQHRFGVSHLFLEVDEVICLVDQKEFESASSQVVPPEVDLSQL